MIERAKEFNRDLTNCEFLVNNEANLRIFEDRSFDMIYTKLVLQHLPKKSFIEEYIREFVRILAKNGLLIFQVRTDLTSRAKSRVLAGKRLYALLRVVGFDESVLYYRLGLTPLQMTLLPDEEVTALLAAAGARILEVERYRVPSGGGSTYFVTR